MGLVQALKQRFDRCLFMFASHYNNNITRVFSRLFVVSESPKVSEEGPMQDAMNIIKQLEYLSL